MMLLNSLTISAAVFARKIYYIIFSVIRVRSFHLRHQTEFLSHHNKTVPPLLVSFGIIYNEPVSFDSAFVLIMSRIVSGLPLHY